MAVEIQDGVPNVFTAGDATSFTVEDSNFPAGDWTSIIVFKDEAGAVKPFPGTQSGTKHLFELTDANTATLVAGQNFVCLLFNDGTHRETRDWGYIVVLSDPAAADVPSYAQTQVTALQAAITTLQAGPYQTVNLNGQSFTQNSLPDFQRQLTFYRAEVIRENKKKLANRGIAARGTPIVPSFRGPNQSIPPFCWR